MDNSINLNKVEFDDVKPIFEGHNIWSDGTEIFWYQLAWECLEKEGLTYYSNSYDLAYVYIRVYTLIMIYGEFSSLISNDYYSYEFFRENVEDILSDFIIGQLIMKLQYEFNKLQNSICEIEFYDNENIENAFFDLVSDQRYKVFNAIENHISKFQDKTFSIFVSMYITVVTPYKSIEDEIPEEILSYESYLSVCDKHYDDISEIIDESDEVLGWLLEGTYRIN
jgi:hypothetical protein